MNFNKDSFDNIEIREDSPRIYFHISGQFLFNDSAIDRFGLYKANFIYITGYKKKKTIASIEVISDNNYTHFKGTFPTFKKNISQGKQDAYFSYELQGNRSGFKVARGKELHILLIMLRRCTECTIYEKSKTHIQEQKEKRHEATEQVKLLFGMNDLSYNSLLFENAYAYFNNRGYDKVLVDFLKNSEKFWTWWKNEYFIVDTLIIEKYIKDGYSHLSNEKLLSWYNDVHAGIELMPDTYIFRELKPNVKVN